MPPDSYDLMGDFKRIADEANWREFVNRRRGMAGLNGLQAIDAPLSMRGQTLPGLGPSRYYRFRELAPEIADLEDRLATAFFDPSDPGSEGYRRYLQNQLITLRHVASGATGPAPVLPGLTPPAPGQGGDTPGGGSAYYNPGGTSRYRSERERDEDRRREDLLRQLQIYGFDDGGAVVTHRPAAVVDIQTGDPLAVISEHGNDVMPHPEVLTFPKDGHMEVTPMDKMGPAQRQRLPMGMLRSTMRVA